MTAALLAACGGTKDEVSFRLAAVQFSEGQSTPLSITAVQNGKVVDVTSQAVVTVVGDAVKIDAGILRAVAPGQATLTAAFGGKTGSTVITVAETPLESIVVVPAPGATFKVGTSVQLSVMGTHQGGNQRPASGTLAFDVSDPRVATVDASGMAIIKAGGPATITAHAGDMVSAPLPLTATCDYPHFGGTLPANPVGQVMPRLAWTHARRPDGSTFHLDMNDLYCNADYAQDTVFIMYVGAGWCYPCTLYAQSLAEQASALKDAHAQVVMVEAQMDNESAPEPADTAYGFGHISDISKGHGNGKPAGFVVGDAETEAPAGQACSIDRTQKCFFNNQSKYLVQFPSVMIVRRSDMKIIADRKATELDLVAIANDPNANWSGSGGTGFVNHCNDADVNAHEPDTAPADAGSLTPVPMGTPLNAGICTANDTDLYTVNAGGNWTATIHFDNSVGNLDLYLWDATRNQPLEVDGQIVASTGNTNDETISFHGNAMIAVQAFNNASASYTLTVTAH